MFRWIGLCLVCAAVLVPASALGQNTTSQSANLANRRVDLLADGTIVVSFTTHGDLAGNLTLTLRPSANGAYAGQWAFLVGHTDGTDPQTGIDATELAHQPGAAHDEATADNATHRDFVRQVERGSVHGAISFAVVTFGANGLEALTASLTIADGTLEFAGLTGTGSASLDVLTLFY